MTSATRDPWFAAYDAPVFTGTLIGLDGIFKDEAEIDVGDKTAMSGKLALIGRLSCRRDVPYAERDDRWLAAAYAAIPVGTRVVAIRNSAGKGRGLFIHRADPAGQPTGPSLNEALVVAGLAEVDDVSAPSSSETLAEAHAGHALSGRQQEPDLTYWNTLHAAWMKAWQTRAGDLAACAAEHAKEHKDWAKQEKEFQEWERRRKSQPGGGGSGGVDIPNFGDGYCDSCGVLRRIF